MSTFTQVFPPTPSFTEANLPSQKGKVFIVTGGSSGVGYELSAILYKAGGKVYIAGRSKLNAEKAISTIKSTSSAKSTAVGTLHYLPLQLEDLSTIKSSVQEFTSQESKLDVLFNNAGVSLPPAGSKSVQGYELMLATNCLGPLLFTKLLLPSLIAAAKSSPPASTRIIWTSSQSAETAPKGGWALSELNNTTPSTNQEQNYGMSKLGNWYFASELAAQLKGNGILTVAQNPGNLRTNLLKHRKALYYTFWVLMHPAKKGAYTELYSGLSPDLTMEHSGGYIIPFGRVHPSPRPDLLEALKSKEEGGSGKAKEFMDWCQEKIQKFL